MPLAGEFVRAADVIPDNWTSYTPDWTAVTTPPALGNGSLTGQYIQVGSLVWVTISLVAGSTTTFGSGQYRFSLPVTPEVDQIIPGNIIDTSSGARWAMTARIILASTTGDNMRMATAGDTGVTHNQPIAVPATSDRWILSGAYKAG